jgi:hypothetical protein
LVRLINAFIHVAMGGGLCGTYGLSRSGSLGESRSDCALVFLPTHGDGGTGFLESIKRCGLKLGRKCKADQKSSTATLRFERGQLTSATRRHRFSDI